jgi:SAM-dependent methyltransferase
MPLSRNAAVAVQYILDEWLPPRLRDSKWFMYLPMKLVLRDAAREFMTFKHGIFTASAAEYRALYERTNHIGSLQGETDLNERCLAAILARVQGREVLEVGCGRGFLAGRLAAHNDVTACDIVIGTGLRDRYPDVTFREADIESLPFADGAFEVVVCTHTLEHVRNLAKAVAELRRVARDQLIIVVPRQRPYKYGFNLHTHFFPYRWSIESAFGIGPDTEITLMGDWLYHDRVGTSRLAPAVGHQDRRARNAATASRWSTIGSG